MKQIKQSLDRFYEGKPPLLSKKWKAIPKDNRYLFLMHYHHLVLVYDYQDKKILHMWSELSADKRGLSSALNYLEANKDRVPLGFERLSP